MITNESDYLQELVTISESILTHVDIASWRSPEIFLSRPIRVR